MTEQFPELNPEEYESPSLYPDGTLNDDSWVYFKDVEQYCLSKQRVKEAIEKEMAGCNCVGGDCPACAETKLLNKILKELGLENE